MEDNSIRTKLAELKRAPLSARYEYYIGKFKLFIWTNYRKETEDPDDNILKHEKVNINLYEATPNDTRRLYRRIYILRDLRFKDYEPIKYEPEMSPYGTPNGRRMPLPQLFELIRYLHKLPLLTTFL